MAEQDNKKAKRRKLDVDRIRCNLSQAEFRRYIMEIVKEPVVFLNRIAECKCLSWTPKSLAEDLSLVRTRFRFCARASSPEYGFAAKAVVMETDCHYLEGTFVDFYEWLTCEENCSGLAFEKYPRKGNKESIYILINHLPWLPVCDVHGSPKVNCSSKSVTAAGQTFFKEFIMYFSYGRLTQCLVHIYSYFSPPPPPP